MEKQSLTEPQIKELEALATMPDEEIDLSDIPEITNWDNAVRGKFYRPPCYEVCHDLLCLSDSMANIKAVSIKLFEDRV